MSYKSNIKTKALKNGAKHEAGFFKALLFSFVICVLVWLVLTFVAAFAVSKMPDSENAVKIISPLIAVISLATGGFFAGKLNKPNAVFISLLLGCAVLGICYGVSTLLDLSRNYGIVLKTVIIVVMILSPLVGARFSNIKSSKKTARRKRL